MSPEQDRECGDLYQGSACIDTEDSVAAERVDDYEVDVAGNGGSGEDDGE